jgi:Ser/Thr protein kinase RdoA (MazF antagonist)
VARSYELGAPLECTNEETGPDGARLQLRAGEKEYLLHIINDEAAGGLSLVAQITSFEPVTAIDYTNASHRMEAAAGLAQFHEVMRDYPGALPLGADRFLPDTLQAQTHWIEAHYEEAGAGRFGRWGGFGDVLLNIREELIALEGGISQVYREEPKIIVHGAYDPSAVAFDGLGLAEVGNFKAIGYDTRLADLSRAILAFCTNPGSDDACAGLNAAWLNEFLSSYEHESPLSDLEARTLPLFLRAHQLTRAVEQCRQLVDAVAASRGDEPEADFEAEAICLSLRLGNIARPPPFVPDTP